MNLGGFVFPSIAAQRVLPSPAIYYQYCCSHGNEPEARCQQPAKGLYWRLSFGLVLLVVPVLRVVNSILSSRKGGQRDTRHAPRGPTDFSSELRGDVGWGSTPERVRKECGSSNVNVLVRVLVVGFKNVVRKTVERTSSESSLT
jgi:hypothetical protein